MLKISNTGNRSNNLLVRVSFIFQRTRTNRASCGIVAILFTEPDPIRRFFSTRWTTTDSQSTSSKTCPDLRNVSCNVPLTRRNPIADGIDSTTDLFARTVGRSRAFGPLTFRFSFFLPFFSPLHRDTITRDVLFWTSSLSLFLNNER